MKLTELIKTLHTIGQKHRKKIFGVREVASLLNVTNAAAGMALLRGEKHELVWRVNNLWINRLSPPTLEELALSLYSPSYISFESALYKCGILSQSPRAALTLATTKRPRQLATPLGAIQFIHVKTSLFFGFDARRLAYPEKAFLDLIYIRSRKIKNLRLSETLYLTELNRRRLANYAKIYPPWVYKRLKDLG